MVKMIEIEYRPHRRTVVMVISPRMEFGRIEYETGYKTVKLGGGEGTVEA